MRECKHKNTICIMNKGYVGEYCSLHTYPVNDIICRRCSDCYGKMDHALVEVDFPKRNNNELTAIQMTCAKCPHFHDGGQICTKLCSEIDPVSIWSQHPSSHCPEGQW